MPVYFIEGNIGTGKSTFLSMIEKLFPDNTQVIYEPVDIWTSFSDDSGTNILEYFYKDQNRYAYTFQNLAFISRIEKLGEIDKSKHNIFIERSIWSDSNVFARNCFLNKTLSDIEYKLYKRWFQWAESTVHIDDMKYVYLRCDPEKSLERTKIRDRKEERGIPIKYINQIHLRHDEWMNDIPADTRITIDVNDINIKEEEVFRKMFIEKFLSSEKSQSFL